MGKELLSQSDKLIQLQSEFGLDNFNIHTQEVDIPDIYILRNGDPAWAQINMPLGLNPQGKEWMAVRALTRILANVGKKNMTEDRLNGLNGQNLFAEKVASYYFKPPSMETDRLRRWKDILDMRDWNIDIDVIPDIPFSGNLNPSGCHENKASIVMAPNDELLAKGVKPEQVLVWGLLGAQVAKDSMRMDINMPEVALSFFAKALVERHDYAKGNSLPMSFVYQGGVAA
ncbi:MAG: hypothetical protein WC549_00540 [Actinomycetota bacterium]